MVAHFGRETTAFHGFKKDNRKDRAIHRLAVEYRSGAEQCDVHPTNLVAVSVRNRPFKNSEISMLPTATSTQWITIGLIF